MAEIEVFRARNTTGLAVNNTRVTKAKPYGLIQTIQKFDVDDEEIIKALEADVQPVKRGEWKHIAGMNSKCSECERYFPVQEFESRPFDINFCPHCGARMDEGAADENS